MSTTLTRAPRRRMPTAHRGPATRSAIAAGGLAALVKLATALPVLGRYGWDRDELYYLQAAHHLSAGYVDFPPLIAVVTRAVTELAGPSLVALRLTGVVAAMGICVLIALCVLELGGGARPQLLAPLAFVATPWGLGLGMLLHPTMLDALTWTAFGYVALRILRRPEPRLWPVLGLIAGIGFEVKGTIIVLIAGFAVGMALFARDRLRDRRVLLAALLALGCAAPYLAWEVAHGWPTLAFAPTQNAATAESVTRPAYLAQQAIFLAGLTPILAIGVRALWTERLRALASLAPIASAAFLIEHGRSYYALPVIVLPLAAGAVALDGWWREARLRSRRLAAAALGCLQLTGLGLGAVLVWPVLPTATLIDLGVSHASFYKDEIGWPQLVGETARAWRRLGPGQRAGAAIIAQNYGEAGALDLLGPRDGLPTALSGHLSFQYWHPRNMPERLLLVVGDETPGLARACTTYRVVGRIRIPGQLDNQEQGAPIARCTLRAPLGSVWQTDIATDDL